MATLYAYSPNGTQATLSYSVIGFTQSLQQNGWCKLPNGLILQWGLYSDPQPTKFPINFSHIPYNVLAICDSDSNNDNFTDAVNWRIRDLSVDGFSINFGANRFIAFGK